MDKHQKKDKKAPVDKNYFNAVSYEFAGEIGIVNNEEMKNNIGIREKDRSKNKNRK